jgi:MoaA/NifB/PqqE/SkfB family radical SAM enzyme
MAVEPDLSVLYRGPLSSCNYACEYCPFAKRRETSEELREDRQALQRFVDWVLARDGTTSVFFTPWGEALVQRHYRDAISQLSKHPSVERVAIQTNLHAPLEFLERADTSRLGLWCTYHPGQTSRRRFLDQCETLDSRGVSYSVGVVGLKEHFDEIAALRRDLPDDRYLWVNAYKREPGYYSDADVRVLSSVDPLFATNNTRHESYGQACRTGETVVSVDGAGDVRRCHFVSAVIGNIYDDEFEKSLKPRSCPNATCGCHIGYVHLNRLKLYDVYGKGVLERAPEIETTFQLNRKPLPELANLG